MTKPSPASSFAASFIPLVPTPFIGRTALIEAIVSQCAPGCHIGLTSEYLGGIGITTLAATLARNPALTDAFPDGILWTGLGPMSRPMNILRAWATQLNVDVSHLATAEEHATAIYQAIGQRQMLLVIDEVWDADVAQVLCCGGPNCCHLLTTRSEVIAQSITTWQGAGLDALIQVPPLDEHSSYQLLQAVAPAVAHAEPQLVQHLAQRVNGSPLALKLLGCHLNSVDALEPVVPSMIGQHTALLPSKQSPSTRHAHLTDLCNMPLTLADIVTLIVENLPEDVASVFYALGAFAAAPDTFTVEAAQAVTGGDSTIITQLVNSGLLEVDTQGALYLHQVLADAARDQTPVSAVHAHRAYYMAKIAELHHAGPERSHDHTSVAAVHDTPFDAATIHSIDLIYEQLRWAWSVHDVDDDSVRCARLLQPYQQQCQLWGDYFAWSQSALHYSAATDNHDQVRQFHGAIGQAHFELAEWQEALTHYIALQDLAGQHHHREEERIALHNIAAIHTHLGQWAAAGAGYLQYLSFSRDSGRRSDEANALSSLGIISAEQELYEDAIGYYQESVTIYSDLGDEHNAGIILTDLGEVYHLCGAHTTAESLWQQAITKLRIDSAEYHTAFDALLQIAQQMPQTTLTVAESAHKPIAEAPTMAANNFFAKLLPNTIRPTPIRPTISSLLLLLAAIASSVIAIMVSTLR